MGWAGKLNRDGLFVDWPLTNNLDRATDGLLSRPRRYALFAPPPPMGEWPLDHVAEGILADAKRPAPERITPTLWRKLPSATGVHDLIYINLFDGDAELLLSALVLKKESRYRVFQVDRIPPGANPAYVVYLTLGGLSGEAIGMDVSAAEFVPLNAWRAGRPGLPGVGAMVLAKRKPSG